MKKVIRHGKEFDSKKCICPHCNCIFEYTEEDIEHMVHSISTFEFYTEIVQYVTCPECEKIIYINPSEKIILS